MPKEGNKKACHELHRRVIVAMSGGVDSSVAAALLKKQGFDVIGVFMKFWAPSDSDKAENRCCSTESEIRARKVAKILNIPFYVFNFEKEFKKRIVDYFLKEYGAGKTPNPCVVCNKEIKFGLLLKKALSLDADFIAAGHYARIRKFVNSRHIRYSLMAGKDKNKDQSYFLWKLNQGQLSRVLFPVGNYTRAEVEKMAKIFKMPFSNVKKSMEVCFVPKTVEEFLKKYLKIKPGNIVDEKGKLLGRHDGLAFYTIGQRKGIGLAGGPAFAKASAGKPYYVLDKDLKKNLLVVTNNSQHLLQEEICVKDVNWVSGKSPKLPFKIDVKIRYRTASVPAIISKILNTKYKILFSLPQRAVTPGQSAVFYKGDELSGGGIIL